MKSGYARSCNTESDTKYKMQYINNIAFGGSIVAHSTTTAFCIFLIIRVKKLIPITDLSITASAFLNIGFSSIPSKLHAITEKLRLCSLVTFALKETGCGRSRNYLWPWERRLKMTGLFRLAEWEGSCSGMWENFEVQARKYGMGALIVVSWEQQSCV